MSFCSCTFSNHPINLSKLHHRHRFLRLSSELGVLKMAFVHCPVTVPFETSRHPKTSILESSLSSSSSHESLFSLAFSSASHWSRARNRSRFSKLSPLEYKGIFFALLPGFSVALSFETASFFFFKSVICQKLLLFVLRG